MVTQVSPSLLQRQRVHERREALSAATLLVERLEMIVDGPLVVAHWLRDARRIRGELEVELRDALKPFTEQPV